MKRLGAYIILIACFLFGGKYAYGASPDSRLSSFTYTITGPAGYSKTVSNNTAFALLKSSLVDGKYSIRVRATEQHTGYSDTRIFRYWIDTTAPSSVTASFTSNSLNFRPGIDWTKDDVSIAVNCSDAGVGCDTSTYQYKVFNTQPSSCGVSGGWRSISTPLFAPTTQVNKIVYICVRANDSLANGLRYSNQAYAIQFDTLPPRESDIVNNNPVNLIADNAYVYDISMLPNGGSGLSTISGTKEKSNNTGNDSFNSATDTSWNIWDINQVDNHRIVADNTARQYRFTITNICDLAGNCANTNGTWSNQNYYHNVYASTLQIHPLNTRVTSSDLLTTGNIADGSSQSLQFQIKDIYGNDIIPAKEIDRKLDFIINIENNLAENQYLYDFDRDNGNTHIGNSSVYYSSGSTDYYNIDLGSTTDTQLTSLGVISSNNDNYHINFKVYTPTSNSQGNLSKWNGDFSIHSIDVEIETNLNPPTTSPEISNITLSDSADIEFNFKPLYTTQLSGEIKDDDLIEGVVQTSNVTFTNNNPPMVQAQDIKAYFKFGSLDTQIAESFEMHYNIQPSSDIPTLRVHTGSQLHSEFYSSTLPVISPEYIEFQTLLNQTQSIFLNQSTYLSTHIAYQLPHPNNTIAHPHNNLDIIYTGEVIGEYIGGDSSLDNTTQSTLKVIGKIHSQGLKQNVGEESNNDYKQTSFGNLSKPILRSDIKKKVYDLIKDTQYQANFSGNTISSLAQRDGWVAGGGNTFDQSQVIGNKDILYFSDLQDGEVVLQHSGDYLEVKGNNTIVIIGGNLYIKDNMYYTDGENHMLGIIVLKDEQGRGGNIYIDPGVTNIVGTMHIEGSIISALSTDNEVTLSEEIGVGASQQDLANQLHIYGSIFSENTIGGASELDSTTGLYQCPFNIPEGTCTKEIAQKYDLNYLRRYQRNSIVTSAGVDIKVPMNNGKVVGNRECIESGDGLYYVCSSLGSSELEDAVSEIRGNSSDSSNLDFPVVIKYNPYMQIAPPPLFGNN